jgi:ERCC4 domain
MSGVIYVDDSSDEEIARKASNPKTASAGAAKTASLHSFDTDVVVLLDDGEDETQQQELQSDSENALFLDQLERAKRESLASLATKSRPNRVSLSQSLNRFIDSDDSDSGDSILNFPVLAKRGQPTAEKQNGASSSVNPNKDSLSLTASSTSSAASQPIVNPYAQDALTKTPKSSASSSTAISSSTSSGPIANPYARKNQGQSDAALSSASSCIDIDNGATGLNPLIFPIETFPYPKLQDHSKQYPDLRASYLLALWKTARSYTSHAHNRAKLDQAVTKVVALALRPWPLRSLEEFMHRDKPGGNANRGGSVAIDNERRTRLTMMLEQGELNAIQVAPGASGVGNRYCSIPEACLVAMYEEIERRRQQKRSETNTTSTPEVSLVGQLASPENWISLSSLIPAIDERLLPICPGRLWRKKDDDGGLSYYLDKSTRSAEYLQIKKLQLTCPVHTTEIQTGYLKEHNFKKQKVFELTLLGWNTAQWIKRRVFPSAPGHYRTSHIASLDNVPPEYKDICVAVDFREGGLQKNVLHNMLNSLDWKNIPYFVGSLNIGDYAFFWTRPGPNQGKLCPILVERKSIQDIAVSITDGRWVSQKKRMYYGQYTMGYNNCRLAYIIEGHEQTQMASRLGMSSSSDS